MKLVVIPVVFLLLTATALAAGLSAVSPIQGATADPTSGFVFSVQSRAKVSTCSLLLDNESIKTVPYNDGLLNKVITYNVPVEDGEHTWQVRCESENGTLSTPEMRVLIKNNEETGVKVTGSGMFRGSMLRAFKFANTPSQAPVEVTKVAPGDIIQVSLAVPPSTIKKELYVKQKSAKDGKQYVVLEDLKGGDIYTLYKGENVTINITTSRILMSYKGDESNRATVIAYPALTGAEALAGDEPATPSGPQTPEQPTAEEQQPSTEPEQPAAEPQKPEQKPQPEQAKNDEAPKQGFFKRVLSWFSSAFG